MRKFLALSVLALSAVLAGLSLATPASAASGLSSGVYRIAADNDPLSRLQVQEVGAPGPADDLPSLRQLPPDDNRARWRVAQFGNGFTVQNVATGYCIDISGQVLFMAACNPAAHPKQVFRASGVDSTRPNLNFVQTSTGGYWSAVQAQFGGAIFNSPFTGASNQKINFARIG